jgi:hypothetical protein
MAPSHPKAKFSEEFVRQPIQAFHGGTGKGPLTCYRVALLLESRHSDGIPDRQIGFGAVCTECLGSFLARSMSEAMPKEVLTRPDRQPWLAEQRDPTHNIPRGMNG